MNQKVNHDSVRFAPIALAIVLFFVLGALALQARADEEGANGNSAQKPQAQERKEMHEDNKAQIEEMRQDGTSQEDVMQAREQNREEVKTMAQEQKEERALMHSSKNEQKRLAYEYRKEELKNKMEERKGGTEERRAQFSVKKQERLSQYSERIVTRMSAAIERLEQIGTRVMSRIEKIEEKGVDLSDALAEVEDVFILINVAKESVALVGQISLDTFSSDDPAGQKGDISEAVLLAKDNIKDIHTALSETVQLIKASMPAEPDQLDGDVKYEPLEISHEYLDGTHTYSGTITLPGACYEVMATTLVAESYPEQISIKITTEVDSDAVGCGPGYAEKDFSVEAIASEEAELKSVQVDGEDVDWELNE